MIDFGTVIFHSFFSKLQKNNPGNLLACQQAGWFTIIYKAMIKYITENISLELTSEKHAEPLFHAIDCNREHLSQFLGWVDNMQSVFDMHEYLQSSKMPIEEKREVSFVIVSEGVAIGRIGLHNINIQSKNASIGYWLTKDAEGKGIITKSCRELINYGFQNLNLNRIEIRAAVNNGRSGSVAEKSGFKKEGTLREAELVNGNYLDLVLYSILKKEWITWQAN